MPRHSRLLAPEHQQYVKDRYLAGDVPPRELVRELAERFAVTVKPAALRQWLTRSGLGKRKAALDAKTCKLVSSATVTAIAKAKAAEPKKHLERWAEKTVAITDKAFGFAESAERPRDLCSAVAAASTSIRMFRILVGIDGPQQNTKPFNYDFGNIKPTPAEGNSWGGSADSQSSGQPVALGSGHPGGSAVAEA